MKYQFCTHFENEIFIYVLNKVCETNFITGGFADFYSKKVLLQMCKYFY